MLYYIYNTYQVIIYTKQRENDNKKSTRGNKLSKINYSLYASTSVV